MLFVNTLVEIFGIFTYFFVYLQQTTKKTLLYYKQKHLIFIKKTTCVVINLTFRDSIANAHKWLAALYYAMKSV